MGFFEDLVDGVVSVVSTGGEMVEGVVDTVVDTVEDAVDTVVDGVQEGVNAAVDWVNANTSSWGWFGDVVSGFVNILGGAVDGSLEGVQDVLSDVFDIVRDVGGIVGSVLRLDFAGVLAKLVDLVIDVVGLVIDVVRFALGGYVVGGIVRAFQRNALREFVEELLQERLGGTPDLLATARGMVGLPGGKFGFPMAGEHRVFRMDSAHLPLWDMHNRGVIDLYQMAGLLSLDSFQVQRPRTVVRTVDRSGDDNWWPINRWTIARYIESQGTDGRLRVYAVDRQVAGDMLRTAREKCAKMAVLIEWNDGEKWTWFRSSTVHDITSEAEYAFVLANQGQYVLEKGLRASGAENCSLLAMAAFGYSTEGEYGRTSGRTIKEGDESAGCGTPGRTDNCCSTVDTAEGSSVIYRDVWPDYVFRYVLPHEIGHCLGLCHFGHHGFQNIMWKPAKSAGLSTFSWGTFGYYMESEPYFTHDDAKNVWRFIVDQMLSCLTGVTSAPRGMEGSRIATPLPSQMLW